jgi:hypothetical protein
LFVIKSIPLYLANLAWIWLEHLPQEGLLPQLIYCLFVLHLIYSLHEQSYRNYGLRLERDSLFFWEWER